MYQKFFSLDELPFDGLPDPRFYYVGTAQHAALELLRENLSRSGSICVLSGPSGSGKTTLTRMLIRSLPARMRIIAIDDPRLDPHMLLATILRASGVAATSLESIAELTLKVRQMLEHSMAMGVVTTVILDEAQGLSDEVIEQIRLVSNIEGDLGKMVNFLLAGQEDLIARIQRPEHQMFWGRVKAFASLPCLGREEVQAYVTYRMQQAGCHEPVFTEQAIAMLAQRSGGLPRLINSIADRALALACQMERRQVSARMIRRAEQIVRNRDLRPLARVGRVLGRAFRLAITRLPLLAGGLCCAAAVFVALFLKVPSLLDHGSIKSLVARDEMVERNYQELLGEVFKGRGEKIEIARFNASVSQSLFRSEALDTLGRAWGYARADGELLDCDDLGAVSLRCMVREGRVADLEKLGRPAVIALLDENLVPFYGVLWHLDREKAELILGRKLWVVRRGYLEHAFDGSYTALVPYVELDPSAKGFGEESLQALLKLEPGALAGVDPELEKKKPRVYREQRQAALSRAYEGRLRSLGNDEDALQMEADRHSRVGPRLAFGGQGK
ncbi:MAG: Flp pilus assembly complex ATPase component TadA [Succinivibrionaceae bacterium]|nr:Flp pilus assembly complex ATPase component TadA [Succinivibrionaceae bacterium]